jgi:hypothetical protein
MHAIREISNKYIRNLSIVVEEVTTDRDACKYIMKSETYRLENEMNLRK